MKKKLTITDSQDPYEKTVVTSLKRVDHTMWEWNPLRISDDPKRLKCPPNIMNKDTLKQYIRMFQRLSTLNTLVEESMSQSDFESMMTKRMTEADWERLSRSSLSEDVTITDWERDIPSTKFHIDYSSYDDQYGITIYIPNKYNKDFVYGDEKVLAHFQMEEWDDNYLGTPESYGGISSAEMTRKDLEKYIKELIEEYEDATGEKYK